MNFKRIADSIEVTLERIYTPPTKIGVLRDECLMCLSLRIALDLGYIDKEAYREAREFIDEFVTNSRWLLLSVVLYKSGIEEAHLKTAIETYWITLIKELRR